jgi:hypothetical protein
MVKGDAADGDNTVANHDTRTVGGTTRLHITHAHGLVA